MGAPGDLKSALSLVFSRPNYRLLAATSFVVFLALFTAAQVYSLPGRNFSDWLATVPAHGVFLLFLLSLGLAALVSMQVFSFRRAEKRVSARSAGLGLASLGSGMVSAVFATASCAACVGFWLSFLGLPAVFLLAQYRWEIALAGVLVLALSLVLVARKISAHCDKCA